MFPVLRLGLAMVFRLGARGWRRMVLLALTCGLGLFFIVACVAAIQVATVQADRASTRAPIDQIQIDSPALTMMTAHDAFRSMPITRVSVRARPGAITPPGVTSWPAPGAMLASPSLQHLIGAEPSVAARFPWTIAGTVAEPGLITPDELFAYVMLPPLDRQGAEVAEFGAGAHIDGDSVTVVPIVVAAILLLPLASLISAAARLQSHVRDRRSAALRQLGLSASKAAAVTAVESATAAAGGCLIGLSVYAALRPHLSHLVGISWYPQDARLPLGVQLAVAAVVSVFTVVIAIVGGRAARRRPLAFRLRIAERRPATVTVTALTVGLGVMAAVALRLVPPGPSALAALGFGLVLSITATVGLVSAITSVVAGRAGRAEAPVMVVAQRRLGDRGQTLTRLATGLTVIYLALGASLGSITFMAGRTHADTVGERGFDIINADVDPASVKALRDIPGVVAAYQSASVTLRPAAGAGDYSGIVTTCADLEQQFTLDSDCSENSVYVNRSAHLAAAPSYDVLDLLGHTVMRTSALPATVTLLPRPGMPGVVPPDVAVTSLDAASAALAGSTSVHVDFRAGDATRDRILQVVSAHYPGSFTQGGLDTSGGWSPEAWRGLLVLTLAAVAGLLMANLAIVLADRASARRAQNAPVLAIGAPPRFLRWAEGLQTALQLGIFLGVSTPVLIVTAVLAAMGASRSPTAALAFVPGLFGAAALLIVCCVVVSALSTRSELELQDLRRT